MIESKLRYYLSMNRTFYLLMGFLSLGLVMVALILQQFGYQGVAFLPCPLCIMQRVGYLGVSFACFIAMAFQPSRKAFHVLATLFAVFGLVVAGRHIWVLFHPDTSCGIDPLETWINQFELVRSLPWLFKADGLCSAQLPTILGLQVPEWSFVWFAIILIVLVQRLFKKH